MTKTNGNAGRPIDGRAERIIQVALEEFAARGFEGAGLARIARGAGVSPATLGEYFPSREELFREVVRSTIVESCLSWDDGPTGAGPAASRLMEFGFHFLRLLQAPGQAALVRLRGRGLERFPELEQLYRAMVLEPAAARVERILRQGVLSGELQVADPRRVAGEVVEGLVGEAGARLEGEGGLSLQ